MSWGVEVEPTLVGWGKSFNLEVGSLHMDARTISQRLPVLGRSGSGKSTLLYLLTFLKMPFQGRVRWVFPDGKRAAWDHRGLDKRVSTLSLAQIRRRYFGFAYQRSTLTPYLSVRENLLYPLQLRKGWGRKEMEERVRESVRRVLLCGSEAEEVGEEEVDELMARYPCELSGGQLQRVALTQAMIHDPYVLFADEPTGSLDTATRKEVMAVVDKWLETGDRLFIWVTHHLSDALDPRVTHRLLVSSGRCQLQRTQNEES
ncbi:MAG: ATP-binding cassette domain-containing protein [Magnetococcales bacterium]|nr:ATP-binding cassette domain-containing protein [Magnetococcales bacterium]